MAAALSRICSGGRAHEGGGSIVGLVRFVGRVVRVGDGRKRDLVRVRLDIGLWLGDYGTEGTVMKVHIVCRNWTDDRVIPRFARYLMDAFGWKASDRPDPSADLNYWLGYFEYQKAPRFDATPTVAYLTHLEDADAAESAKVRLFHAAAKNSTLRVCMNEQTRALIEPLYGKTFVFPLPLETDRFVIVPQPSGTLPVAGFSGFRYKSGRKGEELASALVRDFQGEAQFKASGRGWPCPTKKYTWDGMPAFYQSLNVFVCTSTVEGGPMTTLEALSCGVPVVIPVGVGIHDNIPDVHGIYRYTAGDYKSLKRAFGKALGGFDTVDREALREATKPHAVEAWVDANREAFEGFLHDKPQLQAIDSSDGRRGIYMVAFGDPARDAAKIAIKTIRANLPGIPVALCSDRKLGPEHILIKQPDKDIGGRIAKLKAYDFAPAEWESVLYLDADIEVVHADVEQYFRWLDMGWEFIICKDAHLHDTLDDFQRSNNREEYVKTIQKIGTAESLQINGGVWGFRRCRAAKAFMDRWFDEWNKYQGRDQGALIRALYSDPIRVLWLGNEWNTLITLKGKEYPPGKKGSAGVLHFVGRARRWTGQVPEGYGLTDKVAWDMVDDYMRKHGQ